MKKTKAIKKAIPFSVKKSKGMKTMMPKNMAKPVTGNDPSCDMKGMRKHMGW